jgi:UDP-N-acetylmuramate dehydrogenase
MAALGAARKAGVPYFMLGLGANILVGDAGFRGLVIRNTARAHEFREMGDECKLWSESGAIVKDLIRESVARGWSGLEHYVGIPSTVGGAIWQISISRRAERGVHVHRRGVESCESLSERVSEDRGPVRALRLTIRSSSSLATCSRPLRLLEASAACIVLQRI